jgi:pyruvate,water dikinase
MIREMGALAARDASLTERLAAGDVDAVAADPALAAHFAAYLAKFGDRCTQELKLESLTLHEDPRPVLMAIAAAARTKPRTEPSHASHVGDRLAALLKGKLLERAAATWLLGWAKARVRDRENLRFERTRIFGRVRRIVLALGERLTAAGLLARPRDVFLLTIEELLGAVEGGAVTSDLRGLAALRRSEDAGQRSRPDPPERFSVYGAHLAGLGALRPIAATSEDGAVRRGLACCAGSVTARVRVIDDPRTEALEPGEILVARHTDPGWIAVFANAAGVIAERGSLLSHSAIVAREMGVPCVVALKGATSWLATGDLVRLDGGAGEVEKLGGPA